MIRIAPPIEQRGKRLRLHTWAGWIVMLVRGENARTSNERASGDI